MSTDNKEPISSQPQGTTPMAAGGNRNLLNREVGVDGLRDWSFGLFKCTDECGLCCWSTFCPCVVYTKNKQRLRHLQDHGTPLPGGGGRYTTECSIYGCLILPGYSWVLLIGNRESIRSRYSIRGGTLDDCLTTWCCRSCALTQERREIELEENSFVELSRST
ncbi:PLAC8 family-domain-containing protein [Lactarius quietus]|nr:PLAC8 family-domain-containing protein [Lactarius quietus]KAF8263296.1 PLAC8 family-domain-containing protein [Lactarius quietus]